MTKSLLLLVAVASPVIAGDIAISIPQINSNYTTPSVVGTPLATGLNFPYGLATTADGSVLFGQTATTGPYGILYGNGAGVGSVWVTPKLADGSFGAPRKAIDGLNGIVTSVHTMPTGAIIVDSGAGGSGGSGTRVMSFYSSTYQLLGAIDFEYRAGGWEHSTGASLAVPNPDGSVSVYFNMGSQDDSDLTTATVTATGLVNATLHGDSLYRFTVQPAASSVQVLSQPEQVATGLRNPYGMAIDSSGNLFIADNGIDGTHNPDELGADTLNMIAANRIGAQVLDFGFPRSYVDFATGQWVNGDPNATQPLAAFTPIPDSLGVTQKSEGIAGMAFAAYGSLPFVGMDGGLIIGFHGAFDQAGPANYDNALIYYDIAAHRSYVLIDAGTPGVGHIDSVWVDGHSLYLGDMQPSGIVNDQSGLGQGAIYVADFSSAYSANAPEPATWAMAAGAILAALLVRRRRTSPA